MSEKSLLMEKKYNDIFSKAENSLKENMAIYGEDFDTCFSSFRNLTFARKTDGCVLNCMMAYC